MLSEKLSQLLDMLGASGTEAAQYTGYSPSAFSRIKTGARTLAITNPASAMLTNGLCLMAEQRGLLPLLRDTCQAPKDCDRNELRQQLLLWLFEVDDFSVQEPIPELSENAPAGKTDVVFPSCSHFPERFDALMQLADLSNEKLSKQIFIHASYVSKLRRGLRIPKKNSHYIRPLCCFLLEEISQKEKLPALCQLTEIDEKDLVGESAWMTIRDWLLDYGNDEGRTAVSMLLETLTVTPASKPELSFDQLSIEAIRQQFVDEGLSEYYGTEGLRRAVVRFLLGSLDGGEKQLYLYSDQDIQWMDDPFCPVLMSLLLACVQNGTHITIIHNVARNNKELFQAISFWLPLYMTGQIQSYYTDKDTNQAFSHTLFLHPGSACIESFSVRDREDDFSYHYHTDAKSLCTYVNSFDALLQTTRPLVRVTKSPDADSKAVPIQADDKTAYNKTVSLEHVLIHIYRDKVIVIQTDNPRTTFTLTHPAMRDAFFAFFER